MKTILIYKTVLCDQSFTISLMIEENLKYLTDWADRFYRISSKSYKYNRPAKFSSFFVIRENLKF